MGLLTDRINNKLEKSNLINEHTLNCEPVPLSISLNIRLLYSLSEGRNMIGYRRKNGESNKTAGGKAKDPCKR